MEKTFKIGFSRMISNPKESVPLTGYANEPDRFFTSIKEDFWIGCIAVSDGENTVLMIPTDMGEMFDEIGIPGPERISAATGVPKEQIYMCATHSHAAPCVLWQEFPSVVRFTEMLLDNLVKVAVEAMADLKPARIFTGSIETENMTFVKHYKVRDNETGAISYIGDVFGTDKGKTYLDHATKGDPTLHLVKFVREGCKDLVVANFRAHPHFRGGYTKYVLSADYIGTFRSALENMLGCQAVFFQGACGDSNSSSRLVDERRFTTCESYGLGLAAFAAEGLLKYMTEVEPGPVKAKHLKFYGEINHSMDHTVDVAKQIVDEWFKSFDREKCDAMGADVGIRSPYQAIAIVRNAELESNPGGLLTLNAVSIGDALAFVTFPGELFGSISEGVEVESPFNTTLTLGYCVHQVGYLPANSAYKYTSYETDVTRFKAGTGETVRDTYVSMLKELKG